MRKISGNDAVEMFKMLPGDTGGPRVMMNSLQTKDERASLVFDFLRSWGFAAAFGEMMHCEGNTKTERIPPTELAIRACEIVDAAWSELRHRGWIVQSPSLDE